MHIDVTKPIFLVSYHQSCYERIYFVFFAVFPDVIPLIVSHMWKVIVYVLRRIAYIYIGNDDEQRPDININATFSFSVCFYEIDLCIK